MWVRPNRPELDATKVPTEIDIAWSAGVYEGEGTARLCGKTKRGFIVSLPQKDPEILYRLRDWFGGSIRIPKREDRCHVWEICGDRARLFIALIYGFLSCRRKEQINGTEALYFLRGFSPIGMSAEQLKNYLLNYYEANRLSQWENDKARKRNRYQESKAKDAEFLANLRERNRASRERKRQAKAKVISIA